MSTCPRGRYQKITWQELRREKKKTSAREKRLFWDIACKSSEKTSAT